MFKKFATELRHIATQLKSSREFIIGNKSYNISELVKMPSWQRLREELKGTWADNKKANVRKLRKFLGSVRNATTQKLLIVRNYLTGSGFRWGNIQHPDIIKLRRQVVEELQKRKTKD